MCSEQLTLPPKSACEGNSMLFVGVDVLFEGFGVFCKVSLNSSQPGMLSIGSPQPGMLSIGSPSRKQYYPTHPSPRQHF